MRLNSSLLGIYTLVRHMIFPLIFRDHTFDKSGRRDLLFPYELLLLNSENKFLSKNIPFFPQTWEDAGHNPWQPRYDESARLKSPVDGAAKDRSQLCYSVEFGARHNSDRGLSVNCCGQTVRLTVLYLVLLQASVRIHSVFKVICFDFANFDSILLKRYLGKNLLHWMLNLIC